MAKLYGWGASVVILGAMFKILHYPGADIMLVVGLTTEAVIFFFSAFEKPHEEYDWTLVYPELAGMEDPDMDRDGRGVANQLSPTQELDRMLEEAKIGPELIESLGDGMRRLGDAAGKLSTTVDAAAATNEYSTQLTQAAKNMESLNALYAVQLENTTSQVEAQNSLMEKLSTSLNDSERLTEEVSKLTSNISNLNQVYGNMLSAMNFNRG
ncbi:MAG: gliding motility protein GldL [Bacteroidota bacterium]|nr:gliding motility protein GldL [Bacteroidota bacterium]MDX5426692.1 gliding motility protein GldL [Bacteroidota bacterium]MDX5448131.1 gliding motility protein GldL [Bacteroidota bacterium]MDX5504694.1 gliding motility protein GldL [Bacteroidota bacterium]